MQKHDYKLSFKNHFRSMSSLTVYRTGHQQCPPGYSRGPEVRDHYLIHYVTQGEGIFILNNREFAVKAGQAFIIYPHMTIRYMASTENPWEYWWVGFNGADAHILMNSTAFSPQSPVITPTADCPMLELLRSIYQARGDTPHAIIAMSAGLYSFFAALIKDSTGSLQQSSRSSFEQYQKACEYISQYFATAISVEEVALQLGFSRSQLFRIFKKHSGISPQRFLTELRIREACSLMAKGERSVKTVAYSVGYDSALYFSAAFKKEMGVSPSEYMKKISQDKSVP